MEKRYYKRLTPEKRSAILFSIEVRDFLKGIGLTVKEYRNAREKIASDNFAIINNIPIEHTSKEHD